MDSLKKLNIQENDLEINGNLNLKLLFNNETKILSVEKKLIETQIYYLDEKIEQEEGLSGGTRGIGKILILLIKVKKTGFFRTSKELEISLKFIGGIDSSLENNISYINKNIDNLYDYFNLRINDN